MNSETYNMLALGGLLLGKLILLTVLVCYCCKTRRNNAREPCSNEPTIRTDGSGAHLEMEKQLRKEVEELDKPPKYKSVVLRDNPPGYLESVINAQINPVFNVNWAEDLEKGEVDKEIEQIISRSRENSILSQLKHSRLGFDPELGDCENPVPARGRSHTVATIQEISQRRQRARTASLTQPVATIWIGI